MTDNTYVVTVTLVGVRKHIAKGIGAGLKWHLDSMMEDDHRLDGYDIQVAHVKAVASRTTVQIPNETVECSTTLPEPATEMEHCK
jgi:hypothetical protein